ncbi:hypothetical protein NIES4106_62290 (plasmid) [Fischerella sp. NIES-4106]|nr:hypothetical protein NIES4106_62290 [Fischerella sp. NIES-4106]
MLFIQIEDFIINKQDIKFINFTFTPDNERKPIQEVYDQASKQLEELVTRPPLKSTLNGTHGKGLVTVVLGKGDRITIETNHRWSNEFSKFKSEILEQLNGDA